MFSQKCIPTQKFAVLGAHRNTIPAVWYDRCVTKCAVVKGLSSSKFRSNWRPILSSFSLSLVQDQLSGFQRSPISRLFSPFFFLVEIAALELSTSLSTIMGTSVN